MEEAEAKRQLSVPRETIERLEAFVALLREENQRQNLVSRASLEQVWARHILDSAQLISFSPSPEARWLDLGSGAGFPGLIIALLHRGNITLVESRKLRTDFLRRAAALLDVEARTTIAECRLERFETDRFDVISARAFAALNRTFELAHRFAALKTKWILPKGRNAKSELDAARASWQGSFNLEPSVTDPQAWIVLAEQVRRRSGGN